MKARPILFSGPMVRALLDGTKTQTRWVVKPQPPTEEAFFGSTFGLDRAIADGGKMYSQNDYDRLPKHPTDWGLIGSVGVARDAGFPMRYRCPYGQPGDLLWVRETHWQDAEPLTGLAGLRAFFEGGHVQFQGGKSGQAPGHPDTHTAEIFDLNGSLKKRSGRHTPRWASRLTLEITDVRVERLQAISEADALAEGIIEYEPTDEDPAEFAYEDGGDIWNNAVSAYAALWRELNGPGSWAANPWVWVVEFKVHRANVDQLLAEPR